MRVNGEFVPGVESWFSMSLMKSEIQIPELSTGWYPAPFDQRMHFSIFFQDYLPGHPDFRAHINIAFGTGIPTSLLVMNSGIYGSGCHPTGALISAFRKSYWVPEEPTGIRS